MHIIHRNDVKPNRAIPIKKKRKCIILKPRSHLIISLLDVAYQRISNNMWSYTNICYLSGLKYKYYQVTCTWLHLPFLMCFHFLTGYSQYNLSHTNHNSKFFSNKFKMTDWIRLSANERVVSYIQAIIRLTWVYYYMC